MTEDKETWILYRMTNLVNGKIYVGVHRLTDTNRSKLYLGSGLALKKAVKKYGRNNFTRTTLAEFTCPEDAYAFEFEVVNEEFITREDTYNIKMGGMGSIGFIPTDETRAKLSTARKGKKHTEETKAKMSAARRAEGFHVSYVTSEETKAKLRIISTGNKHSLGKLRSEETKAKMSAAHKGRKHSKETREKMSVSQKGRVVSEKTRANLSAAHIGINTGAKNPNSIAVISNGKYYESISIAAKAEGVVSSTVRWKIANENPKWAEWRFATDEEKLEYISKNKVLIEEILDLTTPKS